MADSFSIDFKGSDVFQGSNLFITVTYTGDHTTHKVVPSSEITVKANAEATNVTINSYSDKKRTPNVDTTNEKIIQYFLVKIDNSSDTSAITLTFSTNIAGSSSKPLTLKQHQYTNQDINLNSLIPIVLGSTIIEDFSPTAEGSGLPQATHENLSVSIFPRFTTGAPIKYCQIPLQIDDIKYTRLFNGAVEIFPFKNNMYYVNTDSNGDINLKFFANKLEDTYVEKISISNIMNDITHSLQKNVLFITKNVTPSDNLANPIIISMNGDEVPPAGSDKNPTFDARIPRSATFAPTDYIYMMSDVNDATPILCTSDRYGNRNFQDKPFKIPYKFFTPFQYNTLYYYLFTIGGDVFRSKNLAFTVSAGPNSYLPPKGNFKLPSILDHSGTEVDEFFVFGITSLGNGITCVIPTGGNKEVQPQDKIDCFVDIITYDPDTGNLKPKSTEVHSTTVTDVSNPLKISIQSSYLTGFGVDEDGNPTPFYIYYTVNKENYSQSWQGFLDTAPLDSN